MILFAQGQSRHGAGGRPRIKVSMDFEKPEGKLLSLRRINEENNYDVDFIDLWSIAVNRSDRF